MLKSPFEPCIPSPAKKVPDSKNWIHEIKHDGYRLIVQREGQRMRLLTRNAYAASRDRRMGGCSVFIC
jgi:bifunctional non-homologous end joining protein LigD